MSSKLGPPDPGSVEYSANLRVEPLELSAERLGDLRVEPLELSALPLQHHRSFEFGKSPEHRKSQLAGCRFRVQRFSGEIENPQPDAALLKVLDGRKQGAKVASQSIHLRDDECVALTQEPHCLVESRPRFHRRCLLLKYAFAACGFKRHDLVCQTGDLIGG